jgi:hypothetical protein
MRYYAATKNRSGKVDPETLNSGQASAESLEKIGGDVPHPGVSPWCAKRGRMMRMLGLVMALFLAWGSMLPAAAQGAVVGRLTDVQGRVDLLKGGKLPATPVQLGTQLESGDVLRSKSLSKAQITLIDNSVITMSPQSRLAIDEFVYNASQQRRQAVIEIFQGLAHVLVNKLFKVDEPDFVVKTHTAVTGVRGTDFGVRLQANGTTILNFSGVTQVANIFPEVGGLDRKISHAAFSFGPPGSPNSVILHDMQGTSVAWGLPPTLPFAVTAEDMKMFKRQLGGSLAGNQQGQAQGQGQIQGQGQGPGAGAGSGPISQSNLGGDYGLGTTLTGSPSSLTAIPAIAPAGLTTGTGNLEVTLLNTITVPPTVPASTSPSGGATPAPPPGPTPSTFTFTQQYYAAFISASNAPYNQAGLLSSSWGSRTGVYDGYFYATTQGLRTSPGGVTGFYATATTGTAIGTATGTVTGILGQALTGTMNYTGTDSNNNIVNRTGKVTILPDGTLTYNWTDTVTNGGVLKGTGVGTTAQTPGTYFSQTATGRETASANPAGNQVSGQSYGDLTGTRVENGITTSFKAGYSVTAAAPNAGTFSSTSVPQDVSITSQGVLGAPDANGVRTGVMTNTATTAIDTTTSGGPVRDVPASGTSPAGTFATVLSDTKNIPGANTLGMWAQTSDPNAQIVTQTYQGSTIITPPGSTTGTLTSTGWGYRTESGGSSSFTTGGMTGPVTQTAGGTFSSTPDPFSYTVAAVVSGSPDRTGPTQGIGGASSSGNALVFTTGTATINQAGVLTNTVNGTWISPDSQGTLTGVTLTQTPGTYFQQTTANTATLSNPTTTAPYTQTTTLSGPVTGTITSSTSISGALPTAATVTNTTVSIQGVATGGAGNMTMTTHQGPGTAVSTFTSPATINNSILTASTLVGRNVANPGANRVPATQTGSVATTLSPGTVIAGPAR